MKIIISSLLMFSSVAFSQSYGYSRPTYRPDRPDMEVQHLYAEGNSGVKIEDFDVEKLQRKCFYVGYYSEPTEVDFELHSESNWGGYEGRGPLYPSNLPPDTEKKGFVWSYQTPEERKAEFNRKGALELEGNQLVWRTKYHGTGASISFRKNGDVIYFFKQIHYSVMPAISVGYCVRE
jgi:hypothetical protein